MDARQNTAPRPPAPAAHCYLVRLTTALGVFYWGGRHLHVPLGWLPAPPDAEVKRYRLLFPAKARAAELAAELGKVFPIVQLDVVTDDGRVVYIAFARTEAANHE
jgi:hypothetical protein